MAIDLPQVEVGSYGRGKGEVDEVRIAVIDSVDDGLEPCGVGCLRDGCCGKILQLIDDGTIVDLMPVASDLIPQSVREGIGRIDLSPALIKADEKKEGLSCCTKGIHVADPRHDQSFCNDRE
mgnify:CR=1 FL=1